MHELSIAMSIVEMAEEEAQSHGASKVQAVHLRLGVFSGVVKDALLASYDLACASTVLEGSKLIIEEVQVEIQCPICEAARRVDSIQLLRCPECGTLSSEVVRGKEIEVIALEIDA